MKILFDGIPLDKVSVSMTMNGAVIPVLANFIVAGEEQGMTRRCCRGRSRTTSSRSSWSATPTSTRPSPRCGSSRTSSNTPRKTCRNSTRSRSPATTCRRPGANLVQELAYTLADGREYVRAAIDARHGCGQVRRAAVVLLRHRDELLHGGAKLRAARTLWHRVMTEFGAKKPNAPRCCAPIARPPACRCRNRTPTTTSCAPPIEAMSAVLGGTQSLHTNSARRGDRAADGVLRPHRAQHPADPAGRDGRDEGRRPAGGLLLRRKPDQRAGERPGR
jgi:methylmalonyl-CoA mutase